MKHDLFVGIVSSLISTAICTAGAALWCYLMLYFRSGRVYDHPAIFISHGYYAAKCGDEITLLQAQQPSLSEVPALPVLLLWIWLPGNPIQRSRCVPQTAADLSKHQQ